MNNHIPTEGEIVYNQGFEFTAHDVTVHDVDGVKVMRYTGRCTASMRNESIRGTGYDGARYGYRVG
jgi:hypothetical protein